MEYKSSKDKNGAEERVAAITKAEDLIFNPIFCCMNVRCEQIYVRPEQFGIGDCMEVKLVMVNEILEINQSEGSGVCRGGSVYLPGQRRKKKAKMIMSVVACSKSKSGVRLARTKALHLRT